MDKDEYLRWVKEPGSLCEHHLQATSMIITPLNLHRIPLRGRHLVESSAGTGKTYAIASLFVRLLLQRGLGVSQILVVTFTEAATEDLRVRVRKRIGQTLSALDQASDDEFLSALVKQLSDRDHARGILSSALQSFDEAAILTIHGFCQRVLQDNAFESSSCFDSELIPDSTGVLNEIIDDFWRIHFYPGSSLFVDYTHRKKWTRGYLLEFAKQVACRPFLKIIPEPSASPPGVQEDLETRLLGTYREACDTWAKHRVEIEHQLMRCQSLDRRLYAPARIKKPLVELDAYFTSREPLQDNPSLHKFCISQLISSSRGTKPPVEHPFFRICESLIQTRASLTRSYDLNFLDLKHKLAAYLRKELRERNRRQNRRFFDDLLLDLLEALGDSGGTVLKEAIGRRYRAVLIDEFQDTDPVQYAIFDSIYRKGDAGLFLIGDPKQAIYGFRGADLFAYLEVARARDQRFTLERNWRSTQRLVKAVNTLFQRVDRPFVFPEILFSPVTPAREKEEDELNQPWPADPAPLKVWFWRRGPEAQGQRITKQTANQRVPEVVASEVVRLLQADAKKSLGPAGRPVSPQDIAILVRTNQQAQWIQEALRKRQVPSVLSSGQNVFATLEALEVESLLLGVIECGDEKKVRAALATDLLGLGSREFTRLSQQEEAWDSRLKAFSDYRELWQKEGFMQMTRVLMAKEGIRARLLAFPDGERRITNLLHLFELLHERAISQALGMEGLLKWLRQQRREDASRPSEEHQIRMESDDPAVRVVTVHRSKGLEYSVVFCPFCWSAPARESDGAIFHDRQDGRALMDIGSEQFQEHRRLSQEESLAEEARLLYVAVTRAKDRCYLIWGALKDAEKSALAFLLHPKEHKNQETASRPKAMTDAAIQEDLDELVLQAGGSIEVATLPDPTDEAHRSPVDLTVFQCRSFPGRVYPRWGISSFSGLVSGRSQAEELPDRDALLFRTQGLSDPASGPGLSIFEFPRGLQAGIFFHELFEAMDFSLEGRASLDVLVRDKLSRHGFDLSWQEAVAQMITRVLSTPLRADQDDLVLTGLNTSQQVKEMPFSFSSAGQGLKRLQKILALHAGSRIPKSFQARLSQLGSVPAKTLMKGFIDLVFQREGRYYLVDWKSNFLGHRLEDYSQPALTEVMDRNWYFLQYHLYVVALHRHLAFRLANYDYQRDFGGVFYIFIRGIDPEQGPDFGIYADRPSRELILELDRCLDLPGIRPKQGPVMGQQSFEF